MSGQCAGNSGSQTDPDRKAGRPVGMNHPMASRRLPQSRFIDLDGPVHYREWPGPEDITFVCLHGLGETHLSWMTVAPSLAALGRVLALDLPGFGLSPRSARSATLPACRALLSGFLRTLATGRVVLIGSSMGGGVAALQAAREPESLSGLVLSSSYLPPDFKGPWAPAVAAGMLMKRIRGVVASLRVSKPWQGDTHWVTESSLRIALADPESLPSEVVTAELELHDQRPEDMDANRTAGEAIASLIWFSVTPSTHRLFGSIACPILVLHAKDDALVPPEWAEVLACGRSNWHLVTFGGADHPVHLRQPKAWLGALGDWLQASSLRRSAS